MALDYACFLSNQEALREIAAPRSIRVVHDAAHSFGSSINGRSVGTDSDICMFSFDPVKSLTAIDAGVLVFADAEEATAAREIRLLGSDQPPAVMYRNARTWDYDAIRIGYRYHLSNVHAALGTSQIAKLDVVRTSRQQACEWYAERLKGLDHVWSPQIDFSGLCPFMYVIRVPAADRDRLRDWLDDRDIKTGIHWRPGHVHTYFQQFRRGPLPVTEQAADELITVPLHSHMDESTVDLVCSQISAYFRH
jgi:dTDP-4-amino-4,6-dideoxygalactose transaminase